MFDVDQTIDAKLSRVALVGWSWQDRLTVLCSQIFNMNPAEVGTGQWASAATAANITGQLLQISPTTRFDGSSLASLGQPRPIQKQHWNAQTQR